MFEIYSLDRLVIIEICFCSCLSVNSDDDEKNGWSVFDVEPWAKRGGLIQEFLVCSCERIIC